MKSETKRWLAKEWLILVGLFVVWFCFFNYDYDLERWWKEGWRAVFHTTGWSYGLLWIPRLTVRAVQTLRSKPEKAE